ncbi:hypothetical protein B0H11DRAFT_2244463 [Mycena galericulata]|nr:hypothetical protein B0H11DRAFT_2244463 [Mycena galericulata]
MRLLVSHRRKIDNHRLDEFPAPTATIAGECLLAMETQLEQTMQSLDIRRRQILKPLTAYRVALAPHKILSDDILREIFIRCAYDEPNHVYYFGPNLRTRFWWLTQGEGPRLDVRLVLSSVCSNWRSVALATHELWNDVDVTFTRENTTRRLKALDDIWFPRSGDYPLTLRFSLSEEDSRITERLIRYAHRCRFLSIDGLHCLGTFLNLPAGSFPTLETLHLIYNPDYPPLSVPIRLFEGAPCLRRFIFCGSYRDLDHFGIPWPQLTQIDLNYRVSIQERHYILTHCSRLTIATVRCQYRPLVTLDISILKLRTLTLESCHHPSLLANASFPSLEALIITRDLHSSHDFLKNPPSPPINLFPVLRKLRILETGGPWLLSDHDVVPWLHACPTAEEVFLDGYRVTASTIDAIAAGSLLPNMKLFNMKLFNFDASVVGTGSIIAMLEQRRCSPNYSCRGAENRA